MAALQVIEAAIYNHPGTGHAARTLDTAFSDTCLDYLNYDRLCSMEAHNHLENEDRDLHRWLDQCRIEPKSDQFFP